MASSFTSFSPSRHAPVHGFPGKENTVSPSKLDALILEFVSAFAIDDVDEFVFFVIVPFVGLARTKNRQPGVDVPAVVFSRSHPPGLRPAVENFVFLGFRPYQAGFAFAQSSSPKPLLGERDETAAHGFANDIRRCYHLTRKCQSRGHTRAHHPQVFFARPLRKIPS